MSRSRSVNVGTAFARGSKRLHKLVRKNSTNDRRTLVPGHVDAFGMMTKVIEVQAKLSARFSPNDVAKLFHEARLAIRREAHHLAFVAVVRKTEKLRRRRVNDAGRVRILNLVEHFDRLFPSPRAHIVEMKSPKPSIESKAARSNGDT